MCGYLLSIAISWAKNEFKFLYKHDWFLQRQSHTIYCKSFKVESFADGQVSSNLLENFRGLSTPLTFKKKLCSRAYTYKFHQYICR